MPKLKKNLTHVVELASNDSSLAIRKNDWSRLKRMVKNIKKPSTTISNFAFLFFGIFISCILGMFTLNESSVAWVKPTLLIGALSFLILGLVFLFLDNKIIKKINSDSSEVLTEMCNLEDMFPKK